MGLFLAMNVQSSSISIKEQALVCVGWLGVLGQLGPTSERPSCDGCREPCRPLASTALRDRVDRPIEEWIFAASQCLKDPSAGLATVALGTPTGAIANIVRMSTVRKFHRSFSKSQRLLHLYKPRICANPKSCVTKNPNDVVDLFGVSDVELNNT